MRPLKITIRGNFWDSQLYKGRLYLWDMDNVLRVYDWDSLIASLGKNEEQLRLPLECAFSRGNLLYRASEMSVIFRDSEVRSLISSRFKKCALRKWVMEVDEINEFLLGRQDNPVPELPDDTALYYDSLYSLTQGGLFSTGAHKNRRNVYMVDRKSSKLWDGQGLSMRIGTSSLAVAAGADGLFECDLRTFDMEPKQVSDRHTLFANYLFASIYGSSDIGHGYLAAYKWESEPQLSASLGSRDKLVRKLSRIVDEDSIFHGASARGAMTFGSQERIYRVTREAINVINFAQKWASEEGEENQAFRDLGSIGLSASGSHGEPLSGGVTTFGLVSEFENELKVVASDLSTFTIPGPITRWRVFPRSVRYENQLHVVLDNVLEIYSFNQDYLVDQSEKKIGTRFKAKELRSDFASSIFDDF
jgi:hypothetical protein